MAAIYSSLGCTDTRIYDPGFGIEDCWMYDWRGMHDIACLWNILNHSCVLVVWPWMIFWEGDSWMMLSMSCQPSGWRVSEFEMTSKLVLVNLMTEISNIYINIYYIFIHKVNQIQPSCSCVSHFTSLVFDVAIIFKIFNNKYFKLIRWQLHVIIDSKGNMN